MSSTIAKTGAPAASRNERIARALQTRLDLIEDEMCKAEELRDECLQLADTLLDEIDELAIRRFELTLGIARIECRLALNRKVLKECAA